MTSYPFVTQFGFRHLGHIGTTTYADYAGGGNFAILFETSICLLTIFDDEQCCIDNYVCKVIIYQWYSPFFIEHRGLFHFVQILYVLCFTHNICTIKYNVYICAKYLILIRLT